MQISHLPGRFGKVAPQPNGSLQLLSSEAKGNIHEWTVVGSNSPSSTLKPHIKGIRASPCSAGAGVLPAQSGAKARALPVRTAAQLPPGNLAHALWTHPDRPRQTLAQGDPAWPQHRRHCPVHSAAVYHPKPGTAVLLLRAKSELRGWAPAAPQPWVSPSSITPELCPEKPPPASPSSDLITGLEATPWLAELQPTQDKRCWH